MKPWDFLKSPLEKGLNFALKTTLLYLVFGFVWIVFSDRLLTWLVPDPQLLTHFQTYKGWFFVALTGMLLFLLISHYLEIISRRDEKFYLISRGVTGEVGEAFFSSLARSLAEALQVDCAFIAEFDAGQAERAQTIAICIDGEMQENFSFDLVGTPCMKMQQRDICWCPRGVSERLGEDHPFTRIGAESCLSVPMHDARNSHFGVLVVLSRRRLRQKKLAESMLRIFAMRAAAELERRHSEQTIMHLAYYNQLTDLPNALLLHQELERTLGEAHKKQEQLAILYLDFDRFKSIERTLGHRLGSLVLKGTAQRLRQCCRPGDLLAHLGADEFVICFNHIGDTQQVRERTQEIFEILKAPFSFGDHRLHVTASVGIALYPQDGDDVETLLKNADAALSRAKILGRNNLQFYSSEMHRSSLQSLVIENRLHGALERGEFLVLYQPQIDLRSERINGMEALVSWKQVDQERIAPSDFIPLAEETGLIDPLGEWIMEQACRQAKAWQNSGLIPQRVSVNVSARQLYGRDLVEMVTRILNKTGLEPRWLGLEITESLLIQNVEQTIATLKKLAQLGVQVTVDDFGTGYSSLSYLKDFPLHGLKIDKSFIKEIPHGAGASTIASAVIAMAHALDLVVIAEGVENQAQRDYLAEKNCDKVQGFFFSRAVPAEAMEPMLRRDEKLPAGEVSGAGPSAAQFSQIMEKKGR